MVGSLCVAMFFSPCIEIERTISRPVSWMAWNTDSVPDLPSRTVLGMVLLVIWAQRSREDPVSQFLEHHEKRVTARAGGAGRSGLLLDL